MKGYKTYIAAGLAVAIAAAELFGIDVTPSLDQSTALNALWAAVVAATLRSGSKADAAKQ